jgi:hypothetical protein
MRLATDPPVSAFHPLLTFERDVDCLNEAVSCRARPRGKDDAPRDARSLRHGKTRSVSLPPIAAVRRRANTQMDAQGTEAVEGKGV